MTTFRIVFSRDAGRDLDELAHWIAEDSGEARSEHVLRRIHRTIQHIAGLPNMGRVRLELDGRPRSFVV